MVWQPILDGEAADRARSVVLDVARAFAEPGGLRPKATDAPVFWAYVAGAFDEPWIQTQYDEAIDAVTAKVQQGFRDCSLYYGAAATGFALAHVSEPGAADHYLDAIDQLVLDALAVEPWTSHYDLIGGLAGTGVYLLERGDAPIARAALDRVVAQLAATSERTDHGTTWHTSPHLLPPRQRAAYPGGYYNCGLAHGVPGVIAMLGRAGTPRARELALDALRWLDAEATGGRYPSWFAPGEPRIPTRTAWCYGDPGVAVATWAARARLGLPVEPAQALALRCAARTFEESGVEDAGICHGAAGLAHIFHRCFQASGDERFRDAAVRWFEQTLTMRRAGGLAGFLAWTEGPSGEPEWRPATSLLEGPSGIALALLAMTESAEPSWDRVLQCDVPVSDSADR